MAVWQYKGEFVPELWLIERYGRIPPAIEDYLMTEDTDLEAIEDEHYWSNAIMPGDIIQHVNSILPQCKSWSDDALMFGDNKSSDFEIWYARDDVAAIYFRWDLRTPDLDVLNQIVLLAKRLKVYIISGDRATVIKPDFQAVLKDVMQSSAYRFCKDPEGFFADIVREQGKG